MRIRIGGVTVGHDSDGVVIGGFESVPRLATSRMARARTDGTHAGLDRLEGHTWTFEMSTTARGLPAALAQSRALEAVWRNPANRAQGRLVTLEYDAAHDDDTPWKVVYGRCGRFQGVTPDVWAISGAGRVLAEFEVLDPLHYTSALSSVWLPFGGVDSTKTVTIGGDAPTPALIRVHGPVENPKMLIAGQEVGLVGVVPEGLFVTIDSRDGRVVRSDGAPVGGSLTRWSRLDYMRLTPGAHIVSASAQWADTGAGAYFEWRDATWGL